MAHPNLRQRLQLIPIYIGGILWLIGLIMIIRHFSPMVGTTILSLGICVIFTTTAFLAFKNHPSIVRIDYLKKPTFIFDLIVAVGSFVAFLIYLFAVLLNHSAPLPSF